MRFSVLCDAGSTGDAGRLRPTTLAILAVVLLSAMAASAPADAEGLRSLLAHVYRSSPELDAERARLRAIDESVPQARAGWGPRIDGGASVTVTQQRTKPGGTEISRPKSLGVQLTQPVFTGFRVPNAVSEAEANVRAGRAQLRDLEGRVLFEAAQAYLDVNAIARF